MGQNFSFNLLASAQTVIGTQQYTLEPWESRAKDAGGYQVDTYGDAVSRSGSIQPIDAKSLQVMGLSMNEVYVKIFDVKLIQILSRTEAKNPPRITWDGFYWQPISPKSDWQSAGGWNAVVCQRQGVASGS